LAKLPVLCRYWPGGNGSATIASGLFSRILHALLTENVTTLH